MTAPVDLIRKKRDGQQLSGDEIRGFIRGITDGTVPDYQASAWLMAVFLRGLDADELAALTDAMLRSGDVLDLRDLPGLKVDKHSTGGVGDKVSLHLAPAVAAAGVPVPMISGRGLGHTGGTLDKLEAIPGFRVDLEEARFRQVLSEAGLALIGQTARLAPADKQLYALRDVTATVESIPLISASIMSKKLAEGIDGLVLDVKVGSGAFMKTPDRARLLAETLVGIGRSAGKRVSAFLTNMDQPLGRWVGNAVEVMESIEVLEGRGPADLVELTLALGGEMVRLGGVVETYEEGRARIARTLEDGSALERFRRCVALQGGRLDECSRPGWIAMESIPVPAPCTGRITSIDTEAIGLAGVALGAGRARKEDTIDPAAWIRIDRRLGDEVEAGAPLVHFSAPSSHARAGKDAIARRLQQAFVLDGDPPAERPLILEVIR
jgi:pyrimidine-nucleoside phosphorylase